MITFMDFIRKVDEAIAMVKSYNDTPIAVSVHPSVSRMLLHECNTNQGFRERAEGLNSIHGVPLSSITAIYNERTIIFEVTGTSSFVVCVEDC